MGSSKDAKLVETLFIEGLGDAKAGMPVSHPHFGMGLIEEIYEFSDGTNSIRVEFKVHGSKALVPEYANLSIPMESSKGSEKPSLSSKFLGLFRGKNT